MFFSVLLIAAALLVRAAGAHTTFPCPCRYPGGVASPGAVICLDVDGKRSLARCEMILNNSSWRFLDEPCPSASLRNPATAAGAPHQVIHPVLRAVSFRPGEALPSLRRGWLNTPNIEYQVSIEQRPPYTLRPPL
jgi:hypothetical protein